MNRNIDPTVEIFLQDGVEVHHTHRTAKNERDEGYCIFCQKIEVMPSHHNAFFKAMRERIPQPYTDRWILIEGKRVRLFSGVKLKEE
jgi:hypothetical protein